MQGLGSGASGIRGPLSDTPSTRVIVAMGSQGPLSLDEAEHGYRVRPVFVRRRPPVFLGISLSSVRTLFSQPRRASSSSSAWSGRPSACPSRGRFDKLTAVPTRKSLGRNRRRPRQRSHVCATDREQELGPVEIARGSKRSACRPPPLPWAIATQRLKQRQSDELRIDQGIAPPEPSRLAQQAKQPLCPGPLHPARRPAL